MKRSISLICSLAMVIQLLLGAVPVWAEENVGDKYTAPESPAVTYNMNVDWKFRKATSDALPLADASEAIKDSAGKQFYEADYDDSDWETVSVPHPINASDSFDETIKNAGEGGIYRGFMFYRKHITVPEADTGKKFFIEFESVRNSVYLYVNGEMAGYYEAGVVATGYDITEFIKPGQDNIIAVATDNATSRGRTNFTTTETINDGQHTPGDLSGSGYEWNTNEFNETQGGITGNVNLYAKSQIYQTLPLYNNLKTTGNYIYASDFDLRDVNNSKASINVKAEIRNETAFDKEITLQVDVVKMDGTLADSFTRTATASAASDAGTAFQSLVPEDAYGDNPAPTNADTVDVTYITASLNMENLRLWSPDDPYMYTVYTILKDEEGNVLDVQEKATGFREVIYDYNGTDGGFKINGKPTYLKGYAQRSTNEWAAIGVANDWLSDYDMQLVKESNSNFIRWMHVAPKPATIRSTDKYGVVSVCPAGDKEKDVEGRQWDQRMEAMRSAIIYYRNSPSVIFWEAGNGDITAEHMQEMTDIKQVLDPNGYRFMGCRTISSEAQVQAAEYIGTMLFRNAGPAQNAMKATGKYIPIMETEFSRGESPRRVWDDFSPYFSPAYTGETLYDYVNQYTTGSEGASAGDIDTWDLTQEDFVRRNVKEYAEFYEGRVNGGKGSIYTDSKGTSYTVNQYVAAALMIWADSNQHGRMAITENCRSSGKVDPVRIKKEAFYSMQAAQSDEPAVHIVGHWNYPKKTDDNYWYWEKTGNGTYWENSVKAQRDPSKKTVYVIGSNDVSKVELYINDILADTCTKPEGNYIYSFPNTDVTQSGKVTAKAYNTRNEVIAEDEIKTAGEPERIKLTPVTGPEGFLADGSDIMYFDVEVVDKDDNICPLSYDKINLKLTGAGTLMGGYNSGANANTYNQENEQTIYAECGLNRVFVRSAREAGAITLSASLDGQSAVDGTVVSSPVDVTDGLTTHKQQALKAGEKPPVIQQTVPALKPLGSVFTADFDEETGNTEIVKDIVVEKDIYKVKVNGTDVAFTDEAYMAGGALWTEAEPVLQALKTAGLNITYSYNQASKTLTVSGDNIVIKAIVEDPDLLVTKNGGTEERVGPMNGAPVISDNGIFVMELSTMLNQLGAAVNTDSENKVCNITYTSVSASSADEITLFSDDRDEAKCVKITAVYDGDILQSVTAEEVSLFEAAEPVVSGNTKIMYWKSLESMEPVDINSIPTPTPIPWKPGVASEQYDTLVQSFPCSESSLTALTDPKSPVEIKDGAPDGTSYIKTGTEGNEKYGTYCFENDFSFGANTKEDIMVSLDVRFDAELSGFTPRDKSDKKACGTVLLRNGTIQVQKGSGANDYVDSKIAADNSSWYHISLVGRFLDKVDMFVWKYDNGGNKTYLGTLANIPLRTIGSNGFNHLDANRNTSIDNIAIYKLGADTLTVSGDRSEISAGEQTLLTCKATRAGIDFTLPAITWEIYNAENTAPIDDENITISSGGLLQIGGKAQNQTINVRASAASKDEGVIYGSIEIVVKGVDTSTDTYDNVTLSAENNKNTVRIGDPLSVTAETTLQGTAVTPGEGDLIWKVFDKNNLRELGNDNIKIENGVLSVNELVVPQSVTVKAINKSGSVSGTYPVEVLPANMNSGNEDTYTDTFVSANACEEKDSTMELKLGSWDGSGYYNTSSNIDFIGFPADTTDDVIYSADMQFPVDGSGWEIRNVGNGSLGLQLTASGNKVNALAASNKVVGSMDIEKNAWYNVQIMCASGRGGDSYAICHVYKYAGGKKVHPQNGTENEPLSLTVNLRNLSEKSGNHIRIYPGTNVDNVMNFKIAPDTLTITLDTEAVLAGGTAQARTTASRKGTAFPTLSNNLINYEIYDAENQYPLGDDKITIDANGKISVDSMADPQDVYVRVSSVSGGMKDSKKLTIKSSSIFEVTKVGFNEDYSVLKRLKVTKNFYYKDDVTFITAAYNKDGIMTAVAAVNTYGDSLNLGDENYVQMNMSMPSDFDKLFDRINVFIITKLSTIDEPDAELTLSASDNSTILTNLPEFDENTPVVVLALNSGADEGKVTDADIAYFNQLSSSEITDTLTLPVNPASGTVIKLCGKRGGQQIIARGTIQ